MTQGTEEKMMKKALLRAFGGLDRSYLFKQYLVGIAIFAICAFIVNRYSDGLGLYTLLTFSVNTLLYPYSRYLFQSMLKAVFGNTVFDKGAAILTVLRVASIIVCWIAAWLIAPFGLVYLYFRGGQKSAR